MTHLWSCPLCFSINLVCVCVLLQWLLSSGTAGFSSWVYLCGNSLCCCFLVYPAHWVTCLQPEINYCGLICVVMQFFFFFCGVRLCGCFCIMACRNLYFTIFVCTILRMGRHKQTTLGIWHLTSNENIDPSVTHHFNVSPASVCCMCNQLITHSHPWYSYLSALYAVLLADLLLSHK